MKKTFRKNPDEALLASLKKEMKAPRKSKSVRMSDAILAKATRKSS